MWCWRCDEWIFWGLQLCAQVLTASSHLTVRCSRTDGVLSSRVPARLPARCSRRRREPGRAGQDAVRAPLRLAGGADQQKDQLAGFRSRGGRRWVVVRRLRMRYGDAVVGLWPACVCAGRLASTPTPCTLCTRPHICSLDCRWRWQRRPPGAVGRCQEALHCHPGHLRLRIVRIQLLRAALHQPGQRTPAAAVQRPCL